MAIWSSAEWERMLEGLRPAVQHYGLNLAPLAPFYSQSGGLSAGIYQLKVVTMDGSSREIGTFIITPTTSPSEVEIFITQTIEAYKGTAEFRRLRQQLEDERRREAENRLPRNKTTINTGEGNTIEPGQVVEVNHDEYVALDAETTRIHPDPVRTSFWRPLSLPRAGQPTPPTPPKEARQAAPKVDKNKPRRRVKGPRSDV